uniref:Uncharacterized protein LOC105133018 n=1 Tax=Rhizophora mucronata TaxID=61149 RepID=A0A2P2N5K7_RHIMU
MIRINPSISFSLASPVDPLSAGALPLRPGEGTSRVGRRRRIEAYGESSDGVVCGRQGWPSGSASEFS